MNNKEQKLLPSSISAQNCSFLPGIVHSRWSLPFLPEFLLTHPEPPIPAWNHPFLPGIIHSHSRLFLSIIIHPIIAASGAILMDI